MAEANRITEKRRNTAVALLTYLLILLQFKYSNTESVLIINNPPFLECDTNLLAVINDHSNYSSNNFGGIMVSIFRDAERYNNLTEGKDWFFKCGFPADIFSMLANSTQTEIRSFMAGASASSAFLSSMKLGHAIYVSTSAAIMTKWTWPGSIFTRIFDTSTVIYALCIFPLLFGVLKFFFDDKRENLRSYIMDTYQAIFFNNPGQHNSLLCRLLQYVYHFVQGIVLLAIFTAVFVKTLNDDNTFGGIQSVSDLSGQNILAIDNGIYKAAILAFGGQPVIYDLFMDIDESVQMFLEMDDVQYMMFALPMIDYLTKKHCNLYKVLEGVTQTSIPIGHSLFTPDSFVHYMDIAGVNATGNKTLQKYIEDYEDKDKTQFCTSKMAVNSGVIVFSEVQEVFVYLAVAVVIGIALTSTSFTIATFVPEWEGDHLAGRRFLSCFDHISATMAKELIGSMYRIHQLSTPRDSDFFRDLRAEVPFESLIRVRRMMMTQKEKKKDMPTVVLENEIPNFSSMEVELHSQMLTSTSEATRAALKDKLAVEIDRRKWIYIVLFFLIPSNRFHSH